MTGHDQPTPVGLDPPTTHTRFALLAYATLALPLACAALPMYVLLPALYGNQQGLSLSLLGAVLLLARCADAVADPLIGWASDRLQQPRTLICVGMLLLTTGMALAFNPPTGSAQHWHWLALALVPLYAGYSLASINYFSWGAQLHTRIEGHTRVTSMREALGLFGVIIASTLPMVLNETSTATMPRYSVALAVLFLIGTVIALRYAPPPTQHRQAVHEDALQAAHICSTQYADATTTNAGRHWPLRHPAVRGLFAAFIVNGIASALPATLVLFFVGDVLQLHASTGIFLSAYFLAGACSLPMWQRIARRVGAARAWQWSMLLSIPAFSGAWLLGAGDQFGYLVVCVLSGLMLGADLALPPALLAHLIQTHHDQAQTNAYFGWWTFVTKLNLALAAGLSLPLLQWLGYIPSSQEHIAPLRMAYCFWPCVLKLLAAGVLQQQRRLLLAHSRLIDH